MRNQEWLITDKSGIKSTVSRLPDCTDGLVYVTKCDVPGVVGRSAPSLNAMRAKLPGAIEEMAQLNNFRV